MRPASQPQTCQPQTCQLQPIVEHSRNDLNCYSHSNTTTTTASGTTIEPFLFSNHRRKQSRVWSENRTRTTTPATVGAAVLVISPEVDGSEHEERGFFEWHLWSYHSQSPSIRTWRARIFSVIRAILQHRVEGSEYFANLFFRSLRRSGNWSLIRRITKFWC